MLKLLNVAVSEITRALDNWNARHANADKVLGLHAITKLNTNPNFTGNYIVTLEKNHKEIASAELHREFAALLPAHVRVE